jgi:nucleoside-diphosphate-sugar epimerase
MKLLLTGSTGFLGKVILEQLRNYDIITLGRKDCDIQSDLTTGPVVLPEVSAVIHAAGKAHMIPGNQKESEDFFTVNVRGTENLLLSLVKSPPSVFVFISSVAVYGQSQGNLIDETAELNATDPYGKSKVLAEKLIMDWCGQYSVKLCVLRLPLVAGPTPPGNLKSMIKGIAKGYYVNIAGGKSRKSIVMGRDIARIIPTAMATGGIFNLTDGQNPTIKELSDLISRQLGKTLPPNVPMWFAKSLALVGDLLGKKAPFNSDILRKLTADLTFDDSKARETLQWSPDQVLKVFSITGK